MPAQGGRVSKCLDFYFFRRRQYRGIGMDCCFDQGAQQSRLLRHWKLFSLRSLYVHLGMFPTPSVPFPDFWIMFLEGLED